MLNHKNGVVLLFYCVLAFLYNNHLYSSDRLKLIMIDPAGDAHHKGRLLHQSYERAITYKWAETLKKKLESDSTLVLLTRTPGEELLPFQVPSLTNRLNVDLFIRLQCYKDQLEKPTLFIYNLVFDPVMDFIQRNTSAYSFIPLHQAHFKNIKNSCSVGKKIYQSLSHNYNNKQYEVLGPYGLPLKALVGISSPSVLLELCLAEKDTDWELLADPIATSLSNYEKITNQAS